MLRGGHVTRKDPLFAFCNTLWCWFRGRHRHPVSPAKRLNPRAHPPPVPPCRSAASSDRAVCRRPSVPRVSRSDSLPLQRAHRCARPHRDV